MKKLLGIFIALFVLGNCLFAGVMEDLNSQLNDIEQEFWAVLASPSDSQYYKEFDARLKKFVFKCQEIQFKISQNPFYKHLPNLTSPAITLTRTFSTVNRPSLIKVGHRRFHRKRTNMFSYRTEFSRIEKERISAEVEAQKERGVKNPKRRKPRYPNLANINVRYYTAWINDIKAANISSVVSSYRGSRGRGKGRKPDPSLRILAEKYSSFMSAIADLRIAIVTIRQQVKDIK